jgi:hypothetical protein
LARAAGFFAAGFRAFVVVFRAFDFAVLDLVLRMTPP